MIERLRKRARSLAISAILAWSTIAGSSAIYAYSNREVAVFNRASLEAAHREGRTKDVRAWNEVIERNGFAFAIYACVVLLALGNVLISVRGLSRVTRSAVDLETRQMKTEVA
jgi:hypothetical protein